MQGNGHGVVSALGHLGRGRLGTGGGERALGLALLLLGGVVLLFALPPRVLGCGLGLALAGLGGYLLSRRR